MFSTPVVTTPVARMVTFENIWQASPQKDGVAKRSSPGKSGAGEAAAEEALPPTPFNIFREHVRKVELGGLFGRSVGSLGEGGLLNGAGEGGEEMLFAGGRGAGEEEEGEEEGEEEEGDDDEEELEEEKRGEAVEEEEEEEVSAACVKGLGGEEDLDDLQHVIQQDLEASSPLHGDASPCHAHAHSHVHTCAHIQWRVGACVVVHVWGGGGRGGGGQ